ncbi:MAG: energy transducer TonB [Planctomycetes bacterium]|nr:energy transducer TonB [Planctomycetota bacterium]
MRRAAAFLLAVAVNAVLWSAIAFVGIAARRESANGAEQRSAPRPVRVADLDRLQRRPVRRKRVRPEPRPRERAPAPVARRDARVTPGPRRASDRAMAASLARPSFTFDRIDLPPFEPGALASGDFSLPAGEPGDATGTGGPGGPGTGIGAPRGPALRIPPSVIYRPHSSAFYPSAARIARVEGEVRVRLLVDARGTVARAEVVSATPRAIFDAAALRYAKTWRFAPARQGDRTIDMWCEVTIRFTRGGEP